MLAHHRGELGRLLYRDGADVRDGTVADFCSSHWKSMHTRSHDGYAIGV